MGTWLPSHYDMEEGKKKMFKVNVHDKLFTHHAFGLFHLHFLFSGVKEYHIKMKTLK